MILVRNSFIKNIVITLSVLFSIELFLLFMCYSGLAMSVFDFGCFPLIFAGVFFGAFLWKNTAKKHFMEDRHDNDK